MLSASNASSGIVAPLRQPWALPRLPPTQEWFLLRAPCRRRKWASMAPMPWAPTVVSCLSAGTLKALFFLFASICAWYSGYLLAELIPEVSLSSAVYSIRSIGERPILKGEFRGMCRLAVPKASRGGGEGVLASALPQLAV